MPCATTWPSWTLAQRRCGKPSYRFSPTAAWGSRRLAGTCVRPEPGTIAPDGRIINAVAAIMKTVSTTTMKACMKPCDDA